MCNLKSRVFEALENAKDNGYDQSTTDSMEVADDLIEFDADLENETPESVAEFVREWQATQ